MSHPCHSLHSDLAKRPVFPTVILGGTQSHPTGEVRYETLKLPFILDIHYLQEPTDLLSVTEGQNYFQSVF